MKRLLCIFIILVLALPLLTLPISAEEAEKAEFVIFENGKYTSNIVANNEADKTILKDIFHKITQVPYDEALIEDKNAHTIYIGTASEIDEMSYCSAELYFNEPGEAGIICFKQNLHIIYTSEGSKNKLLDELRKTPLTDGKLILSSASSSIFLSYIGNDNPLEQIEKKDNEDNFFEKAGKLITGFFNLFSFLEHTGDTRTTIENGGFNFVEKNSRLNLTISEIYKVLYPVGFIVMLLCWAFGIAKTTISSSLDIKDKSSIINAVISLIIGLAAMSLAPQILTLLTSVSQWLCTIINDKNYITWQNWEVITDIDISEILLNTINNSTASLLTLIILEYVFMINILWIALLQCLSPIFIGLMANQSTRKISFNFIKEYFKALLIPVTTLIYYKLASALLWDLDPHNPSHTGMFTVGMIGAIVLGIATVSIAGKKLDKLIN